MSIKYVAVTNNMYNSTQIRPVKWWRKIIGFPGETVVGTVHLNMTEFNDESLREAIDAFSSFGFKRQIMGVNIDGSKDK